MELKKNNVSYPRYNKLYRFMYLFLFLALNFGVFFALKIGGKQLNLSFSDIMLYVFIAIFIFLNKFNLKFPKNTYLYISYIILFWVICVTYWSTEIGANLAIAFYLIIGIIAYLFSYNILLANPDLFNKGLRLFGVGLSLFIFFSFAKAVLMGIPIANLNFYQIKDLASTPLGKSNYLAIYLEFIILYEYINKNRKWQLYSVLFLFAFVLTFSRTGYIVFFLGLVLIFLIKGRRSEKESYSIFRKILIGVAFISITIVTLSFLTNITSFDAVSSVLSRIKIWQSHLSIISSTPIIGDGYQYNEVLNAHNIILTILSSFGIVGFLLFSVIFFHTLYYCLSFYLKRKRQLYSLSFLIPFIILIVHSFFEPFFLTSTSQIFIASFVAYLHISIGDFNKTKHFSKYKL